MFQRATVIALATVLVASGCALTSPVAKVAPAPETEGVIGTSRALASFKGVAVAPASLIASNGSTLVGNNASTLISDKAAGYALLAVEELKPVADAEVEVQDAAGNPVKGVDKVKTDAKGEFTLKNVPAGINWVVEVKTTGFHLTTIVRPSQAASARAVELNPATTAVTEHLRASFGQNRAALRQVQPERFEQLTKTVDTALAKDSLNVDLKPQGKAADVLALIEQKDGGIGQEVKAIVQAAKDAHEVAKAKGEDDDSDAGKPAVAPSAKPADTPGGKPSETPGNKPEDAGKPSTAPDSPASPKPEDAGKPVDAGRPSDAGRPADAGRH